MPRNSIDVSTKQERIAALAKQSPQMAFTSLCYLMDIDWLKEAYRRTRKDGAVGVDGVTADEYQQDLEANLQSLLDRAKSGAYHAPPVRRVHIPKGGSSTETRPIGIPTLEDKVLQRAVVMLLEPIYEQDFDAGSYGFRPGRSAHDALLERLVARATSMRVGPGVSDPDMGPIISKRQLETIEDYVKVGRTEGALVAAGGERPSDAALGRGFYYRPTLLDRVSADMRVAQEEIFGPVVSVITFKDEDELITCLQLPRQLGVGEDVTDPAREISALGVVGQHVVPVDDRGIEHDVADVPRQPRTVQGLEHDRTAHGPPDQHQLARALLHGIQRRVLDVAPLRQPQVVTAIGSPGGAGIVAVGRHENVDPALPQRLDGPQALLPPGTAANEAALARPMGSSRTSSRASEPRRIAAASRAPAT